MSLDFVQVVVIGRTVQTRHDMKEKVKHVFGKIDLSSLQVRVHGNHASAQVTKSYIQFHRLLLIRIMLTC